MRITKSASRSGKAARVKADVRATPCLDTSWTLLKGLSNTFRHPPVRVADPETPRAKTGSGAGLIKELINVALQSHYTSKRKSAHFSRIIQPSAQCSLHYNTCKLCSGLNS